jgi:hypothetical protein
MSEISIIQHCRSRLSQKPKNINRKERRDLTQRAQSFEFELLSLCVLREKTLRPCGKNTFKIVPFDKIIHK